MCGGTYSARQQAYIFFNEYPDRWKGPIKSANIINFEHTTLLLLSNCLKLQHFQSSHLCREFFEHEPTHFFNIALSD